MAARAPLPMKTLLFAPIGRLAGHELRMSRVGTMIGSAAVALYSFPGNAFYQHA